MSTLQRVKFEDADKRPDLDFVLPGLLAGTVGMVVGQGAVGKSYLALMIGLGVALGRPVAGGLWQAPHPGKVTLIFGEDQIVLLRDRLFWIRQHENLSQSEINIADENIDVRSGFGHDLRILVRAPNGLENGPFFDQLLDFCGGQRLVVLDPLAFLSDADENDNGAMTRLMQILQKICRETGATIIVLHHVGKSSGNGDREEWAAARGASALTTACRWQVNLNLPSKKDCDEFGIEDEMRGMWVRVAVVKTNYGEPQPATWLHRLKGGVLGLREMVKVRTSIRNKVSAGGADDDF